MSKDIADLWMQLKEKFETPLTPGELEIASFYEQAYQQLQQENERLKQWVNDLHSSMYVNCVYCGHRYGPKENTPVSMSDVLRAHIEKCPMHPMSALKQQIADLTAKLEAAEQKLVISDKYWQERQEWRSRMGLSVNSDISKALERIAQLEGLLHRWIAADDAVNSYYDDITAHDDTVYDESKAALDTKTEVKP